MHFRGGRGAIDAEAYPDIDAFYDDLAHVYREEIRDLAAAGCPLFADRRGQSRSICAMRSCAKQVATFGEDPTTLPRTIRQATSMPRIKDRPAGHDGVHAAYAAAISPARGWRTAATSRSPSSSSTKSTWMAIFSNMTALRAGTAFEPLRFLPRGKAAVLVWYHDPKSAKLDREVEGRSSSIATLTRRSKQRPAGAASPVSPAMRIFQRLSAATPWTRRANSQMLASVVETARRGCGARRDVSRPSVLHSRNASLSDSVGLASEIVGICTP